MQFTDSRADTQRRRFLRLGVSAVSLGSVPWAMAAAPPAQVQRRRAEHPRLLGMNIGAKNYDDAAYQQAMSRLDIVILGLYPGWRGDRGGHRFRELVRDLKQLNPSLLIGQYTILNESGDNIAKSASRDRIEKLDREDWWLRRADGAKTAWTDRYSAYDTNFTEWSRADSNGDRYPQWLAKRDHEQFFRAAPGLDVWYFDNVMIRSRVKKADWRRNGIDLPGRDPAVESAFRQGMADHWSAAQRLKPDALLFGNVDNDLSSPEYRGQLHGAFLEGMMGKSWSIDAREGWQGVLRRYLGVRANLRPPAIVAFNVSGRPDDYAFFRYAFCTSLMGEGHFSFSDATVGYSSVPWFDEYDVPIGKAIDPPPSGPWTNGIYRRRYERAMALVNPEAATLTAPVERGWSRLKAAQDRVTNNGEKVSELSLGPRSGLLLIRD